MNQLILQAVFWSRVSLVLSIGFGIATGFAIKSNNSFLVSALFPVFIGCTATTVRLLNEAAYEKEAEKRRETLLRRERSPLLRKQKPNEFSSCSQCLYYAKKSSLLCAVNPYGKIDDNDICEDLEQNQNP